MRECARVDDCSLQPRDGRCEAPDRKLVTIRNADDGTRERRVADRRFRAGVSVSVLIFSEVQE